MVTVLDLKPHLGSACLVGTVGPLAHNPFQAQPASGLEYFRAVTFEMFDELQTIALATQKCLQPALTLNEREIAKIRATKFENVKRQKHSPIVFRAAAESVEVADAILGYRTLCALKVRPEFAEGPPPG